MRKILLSALLVFSLLLGVSCAENTADNNVSDLNESDSQNKSTTDTMSETPTTEPLPVADYVPSDIVLEHLYHYVMDTSLPPLVTDTEPTYVTGNRPPVDTIRRARQSMIGREVAVFPTADVVQPLLICFEKQSNGKSRLTIAYMTYKEHQPPEDGMVLALETEYQSVEELFETDQWEGFVTNIGIFCSFDYFYSIANLSNLDYKGYPISTIGPICVGQIEVTEEKTMVPTFYSFSSWEYDVISPIKISMERFGLLT